MNKKYYLALAALILSAVIALAICINRYVLVQFTFYPRSAVSLDLRGQDISIKHYEKLARKLPNATIRWDVPFQGGTLADDAKEVTLCELSVEDAQILARHLPKLRRVDGQACTQFDGLMALKQLRPAVQVDYWVPMGGGTYASTAIQIRLDKVTQEDIELLQYLPFLKTVSLCGGDPDAMMQMRDVCAEAGITARLIIQGEELNETARTLSVTGITDGEVDLMYLLPDLKQLHISEPEAAAEKLLQLRKDRPEVRVTWEKTILGQTYPQDVQQIDLTDIVALGENQKPGDETAYAKGLALGIQGTPEEVRSAIKILKTRQLPDKTASTAAMIEEVEAAMAYFPEAETLVMCGSVLDNDAMAAFRQRHEDEYKVVWSVDCGQIATRTDATFFMPVKYHVYYLQDAEAANLRYCPEMVAVDIGHMSVSDISFVEYMPNLRYLILAHTAIRTIEPIRSCKNLVFLEVDNTGIMDFSPLLDCTSLEDLNIGKTWNDVTPLTEMTWLKNLWMIFREHSAPKMIQALPNTKVVYGGDATVACGWRDLPNYYAMRDELKMFYMTW